MYEIFEVDIKKIVQCHRVLSRSERPGLSHSFKERSILSRSFFEFLATYETQKNETFFPVLFKRTGKNVKDVPFFCKERERMPRSSRSFIKDGKERENVFLQKNAERFVLFSIYIYRYI